MKKRFLAVAVAGLMAISLAGCGGGSNSGSSEADKTTAAAADSSKADASKTEASAGGKKINVIAKGFQHQFWKAVELGSKKAAEEFGVEVTFQGPDNESAIAQQVEYLNAAIANKPTAICLAALDTKASLDSIKAAQDAAKADTKKKK